MGLNERTFLKSTGIPKTQDSVHLRGKVSDGLGLRPFKETPTLLKRGPGVLRGFPLRV